MGGLWVDYKLMTTIPGLYCAGRGELLRPRRQPPRRLGAHAGPGRRLLRAAVHDRATTSPALLNKPIPDTDAPGVRRGRGGGPRPLQAATWRSAAPASPDHFHRELGKIIWDYCGMDRTAERPREGARRRSRRCARSSRRTCASPAPTTSVNQTLEKAGRVDDFFELGMLMCRDALERARRAAAATSAPSTRPTRARPCATTRTSPTSPRGSGPATRPRPDRAQGATRVRGRPLPRRGATSERRLTNLTLKIWRQDGPDDAGPLREPTTIDEISDEASFLEMLDILNERLIEEGKEPIAFDHDCREGICGTCSLMINGQAHGPQRGTATCQLHMRKFSDGDEIVVEPWRAAAFPIIKDLMVDRSAFDRIIEAGGYITAPTGGAPDANLIPIPKPVADASMDAAACIGCGACVAACPNGAAQPVHLGQARPPQPAAPGPGRAVQARRGDGRDDGRVLRFVHEPRRVPGGVPEGDLDRLHRPMNSDYLKSKFKNRKSLAR